MRILIVSDAWLPQVNGVVTTLQNTLRHLEELGHVVEVISPLGFRTLPCPTYPDIRLAVGAREGVARRVEAFTPDAIHISTEGPLGLAARRYCVRMGHPFTTAYHTQFPEYIHARCRLPLPVGYRFMRWFHNAAAAVMVATPAIRDRLQRYGIERIVHWSRGVDTDVFHPAAHQAMPGRPIFLNVGRVAVEKNLEAFLNLDLPGTKWIVGDGPGRRSLQTKYPRAVFLGMKTGVALAHCYQQADAFVFPSRTDTFGLVLVEAMACGTPVAAFPVDGPKDVVLDSSAGVLDEDLRLGALKALSLDREFVAAYAKRYSWRETTEQFISNLKPATADAMFSPAWAGS